MPVPGDRRASPAGGTRYRCSIRRTPVASQVVVQPAWNVYVSARAPAGVKGIDTVGFARLLANSDLGGTRQTRGYGPTSVDVEVHEVKAPTDAAARALVEARVIDVLGAG